MRYMLYKEYKVNERACGLDPIAVSLLPKPVSHCSALATLHCSGFHRENHHTTAHCSAPRHTAQRTLQCSQMHTAHCSAPRHTAHCSALRHTAHCSVPKADCTVEASRVEASSSGELSSPWAPGTSSEVCDAPLAAPPGAPWPQGLSGGSWGGSGLQGGR